MKPSLQELSQFSCSLQVFYKFLVLSPNFQVVANSLFVPPADTQEHRGMPNTETAHQLAAIPTSTYHQRVIRQWEEMKTF